MAMLDPDIESLISSPTLLRTLGDTELMNVLGRGCNDALAVLFERYGVLVFRIARAILRDNGEAEETVQRVFLDVFRAVHQFNPNVGSFKTWLLQYAYHRTINRREHLQAGHFYDCEELDRATPSPTFHGAGQLRGLPPHEVAYLVEQMLALLEPHQRKVVELTYFEGLTAEEVGRATGNSASSVRNHLYRGLAKLLGTVLDSYKSRSTSPSERRVTAKGMILEQS
jgi:RNA polymerase sigma-70 factor (ECF subfamily)